MNGTLFLREMHRFLSMVPEIPVRSSSDPLAGYSALGLEVDSTATVKAQGGEKAVGMGRRDISKDMDLMFFSGEMSMSLPVSLS